MGDSVGKILEKRRHSLGKSLIEAEEITKIRAKKLEALEHGEYESLPSPAYVKGYISAYARFLRLDPEPLLEAYEREIGLEAPTAPHLPDQVVASRAQAHSVPFKTAVTVVAVIVVIVALIWGAGRLLSSPEEPPPLPVSPEPTPTVEPESTPTPLPGVTDDEVPPTEDDQAGEEEADESSLEIEGPFEVRVVIDTESASWMRVTIDDLVAYEGTMAGGQAEEWTAEESAVLRIGRAPAVTVYQNGVPVEIPPGDPPVLELPVQP